MKQFFIYITLTLTLCLNGCILDSLNELPLNIPISLPVVVSGNGNEMSNNGNFCLENSELFLDYEEDIKEIKLLEITFRPIDVDPSTLNGDLRIIVRETDQQGQILLDKTYTNLAPMQFTPPNSPYILPAGGEEFKALNEYLSKTGRCFYVEVVIENIQPSGSKTINGFLDFVFRTTTDLG